MPKVKIGDRIRIKQTPYPIGRVAKLENDPQFKPIVLVTEEGEQFYAYFDQVELH